MPPWESRLHTWPASGPPGITYAEGNRADGAPWRSLVFRAMGTGQMVGFILQHVAPSPEQGMVVLQVDPAWQRRGIATALALTAQAFGWDLTAEGQKVSDDGAEFTRSWS